MGYCYEEGDGDDNVLEHEIDDAAEVLTDNGIHIPTGRALFASPEETLPPDKSVGSRPFDVGDPEYVLNGVTVPHCVTHGPARSDCPDCSIANRRCVRTLAGVSTTVAHRSMDIF